MRNYTTPFRSHRRISLLATLAAAMMAVTSLVSSAAGAIPVGAAATPVPATHVITLTVSSGGTTHLAAKGDIIRVDLVSKGIQWSPVTVTQSGTVVVPLPVTTPVADWLGACTGLAVGALLKKVYCTMSPNDGAMIASKPKSISAHTACSRDEPVPKRGPAIRIVAPT